ncbi:MAG: hypothetical protein KDK91_24210 [Gammaproteobacteria bacterium]|nr:hypothetical protein [Gammaproteobacteria bacterium]
MTAPERYSLSVGYGQFKRYRTSSNTGHVCYANVPELGNVLLLASFERDSHAAEASAIPLSSTPQLVLWILLVASAGAFVLRNRPTD